MKEEFLKILACPMCKTSPLRYEPAVGTISLACSGCGRKYSVKDSIPNMLPEKIAGDLSVTDSEWSAWSGKLQNFIQWRKTRWNESQNPEKIRSDVDLIKKKFVDFSGLRNSRKRLIDIGCGDGGLKAFLGACDYYGVDPLLIPGHRYDFPMVRGVGEHLSFRGRSFDAVILNQVLDHCNSIDEIIGESARVITDDGAVCVMQYLSETGSLANRIYKSIIEAYRSIQGCGDLDVKTRRFNSKGLIAYFRERFGKVDSLEYSPSQLFIRAEQPSK